MSLDDSLPLRPSLARRPTLRPSPAMLPTVSFAQAQSLGSARRFALSALLTLPIALYFMTFGQGGPADTVSAYLREGAVYFAQSLGAGGAGALFVSAIFGTFVIPMLAFALAWTAGRLGTAQVLLAWLGQSLVNACQFVNGVAPAPAHLEYAASLRLVGLQSLGLEQVSMTLGAVCFLVGAALFVVALVLPLRYSQPRRTVDPSSRTYRTPSW